MNFKKRVNGSWTNTPHYIHNTSTDTLTTLPADVYANDTTATVGLKGNMSQSGTPTPTTPIMPEECGDLETVGEKAGQYKIPILSANTTAPVYLGQVQSTRRIRKLVLTGQENYAESTGWKGTTTSAYYTEATGINSIDGSIIVTISSHFKGVARSTANYNDTPCVASTSRFAIFRIETATASTATEFKQWVAQQYANGTPVCVWYVLATPQTAVVNEPIRKIGDYADTVSGITIPTIAGANSFDVLTTLKPSEVTVNYKGWHPVADVHERDNGAWD